MRVRREEWKTDAKNSSERWAIFISWGPRTPDTRYGNRKSFFSRTPGLEAHSNPSRTFDHYPRSNSIVTVPMFHSLPGVTDSTFFHD